MSNDSGVVVRSQSMRSHDEMERVAGGGAGGAKYEKLPVQLARRAKRLGNFENYYFEDT